jgi:hypothetical protein
MTPIIPMNADQVERILAVISGYWATPFVTNEEAIAYTTELTGPAKITYFEAMDVIKAESGRMWRPRPGELVQLVRHYRRQDALRLHRPALGSGVRISSRDESLEQIKRCRELLGASS